MSDEPVFHPLDVPPDVLEQGGHEVLRASVSQGGISVALRRSFDDPFVWGRLLADLARQAASVYGAETEISEAEALASIVEGLKSELEDFPFGGPPGTVN
jgi:hypothetical protein